ncbi:unnamed protein product [Rotaria sordida]|uniref:Uncharacterized protein n=1 Tax=Rotaria sordida TaxID=392033 RepID=A0A815FMQ2_9BILA|nr:unnamed protein product [Rotaria sordida]CAF1252776.1 unnamed protein product [Rotaria sordida]CAF1327628.1 unnamed protein product [Rotaria sordida]
MYVDYCQFSSVDWYNRFTPADHIWVYMSAENRGLAVYVQPQGNNMHHVWHYNNYNGQIVVHPCTQLSNLSV